jgi:dCMP deaminase
MASTVPAASPSGPREGYLIWDDFFSALTSLASQRSKDPSTQVGAVIVDPENRILSIGYNGFPRGCPDTGPDALPWAREGDPALGGLDTKYAYVVHAECNAILNKNSASLANARMYVGLFPCNECAKMIIQSGIREVVYLSDKYHDAPSFVASRRMLALAGVALRHYTPTVDSITLRFGSGGSGQAAAASAPQPHQLDSAGAAGAEASQGSGGGGSGGARDGAGVA